MRRNVIFLFIFCILAPCLPLIAGAQSYIISTLAGTGAFGYSGDGGAAVTAQLNYPRGIAVDGSGNVYIADHSNQRIRKITIGGTITTIASTGAMGFSGDGGPATSAQLNYPYGIAVDGSGNIYVADINNQRIRKISVSGIITTIAGIGTFGYSGDGGQATSAQLSFPAAVAVDGFGNIYIADVTNSRIRKVNSSGVITTIAGGGTGPNNGDGGPATAAVLNAPYGVAVDGSGNVYIAEWAAQRIRKVSSIGIITTIAGDGSQGYSGDGSTATSAQLNNPFSVAVDGIGNVFIADFNNNSIRKVSTGGIITTIAGNGAAGFSGDGGLATIAKLYNPFGVAVDGAGNVYITDFGNQRSRKLTPFSTGIAIIGKSGANSIFWPSPAKDYLIGVSREGTIRGVIMDMQGRAWMQVAAESGERINITSLSAGIYILKLGNGSAFKIT